MTPRRFHCDPLPDSGQVTLDRDQAEHARKSLRLSLGDTIELFDGSGSSASATITDLHRQLTATIVSHHASLPLTPHLTLAVAIPKGPRADTLIDQATQLGVCHLIPLITQRSIVDPRDKKIDRFRRIVIEACKQSHRPHFMTIDEPLPLPAVLARSSDHDIRWIADTPATPSADVPPRDVQSLHPPASPANLHTTLIHARRILVLVGPEGGWTDDERAAAQAAGFRTLCLAPYVLRVETAALAAAAIIRAARNAAD